MTVTSVIIEDQTPPALEVVGLSNTEKGPSPPSPRSSPRGAKKVLSLLALFATLFISALNATIVATTIPTIVHEFSSPSGYAWITAAYLLGSTVSGPVWAKLSDIWGRKPMLLTAVALYACFSLLCALATSMGMLIAGRALQGAMGGGLLQLVTIVISDMFSMRHRGLYLGLTEIVWTLAAGTGPVMGGAFAEHLSWRWIFWIVLPICFVAFLLLLFALDVHNPRTPFLAGLKAIDWGGIFSIVGILIMFLLGLNFGGAEYAWNSATVICLMIFGLLMTTAFVFCEKKLARYPLIPLEIFMSPSNIAVMFVACMKNFALTTIDFYFPLFFQAVRNASPTESGYLILPSNLMICFAGFISGIYMSRYGRYIDLIYLGTILLTLGTGLFILWSPSSSPGVIIGFQIIAGLGNGCLLSPTYVALQANVPQKMTATATASLGMLKNIGGVLSIVIGHTIFQNSMVQQNPALVAAGVPRNITILLDGQNAAANLDAVNTLENGELKSLIQDTFANALRNVWILNTAIAAAGALATLFIRQMKLSDQHVEARTGLEKETTEQ